MLIPALLALAAGGWTDFGNDAHLWFTAPVRWESADWGLAAGSAALTLGLAATVDRPVRSWADGHRDPDIACGADFVRQAGNAWYTVPMLGALWGAGRLLDSPREERVAREATEALVLSAATSQLLKYSTGRRRPFATDDPWDWNASRGADGNSLPSGHAQAAWSVLTVVGLEYRDVPGIAPLAFGLATACSASRVYDGKHWASDAVAGSLLGFAGGWAMVAWNRSRMLQASPQGISLRF